MNRLTRNSNLDGTGDRNGKNIPSHAPFAVKTSYVYYQLRWTLRFGTGTHRARLELQHALTRLGQKVAGELAWSEEQAQAFFESLVQQTGPRREAYSQEQVAQRISQERIRLARCARERTNPVIAGAHPTWLQRAARASESLWRLPAKMLSGCGGSKQGSH